MKNFLLTLLVSPLFGFSQLMPPDWEHTNWGFEADDIRWINSQTGLICQGGQNSYYTNNGGFTWQSISPVSGIPQTELGVFRKAKVISGNHAMVLVGRSIYSTNNFSTYTPEFSPIVNPGELLWDIESLDENNIYVAGGYRYRVYIKRNGVWREKDFATSGNVHSTSVAFTTPLVGCLGTDQGSIYFTSDSGNTWTQAVTPAAVSSNYTITSIAFRNSNEVLATVKTNGFAMDSAFILRSTNAGQSWGIVYSGFAQFMNEVAFRTPDTVYAVGWDIPTLSKGLMLQSNNGGVSWNALNTASGCGFESLHFESPQLGWLTGFGNGCIYKYDSRPFTAINETPYIDKVKIYPNPATYELNIELGDLQAEEVSIYNVDGKLMSTMKLPANNRIDISSLANGVYIAEIKVHGTMQRIRWVKM